METVGLCQPSAGSFKAFAVVVQRCGDRIFVNFGMPITEVRAVNSGVKSEVVITHVLCLGVLGSSHS
jgi:hypothetical protein